MPLGTSNREVRLLLGSKSEFDPLHKKKRSQKNNSCERSGRRRQPADKIGGRYFSLQESRLRLPKDDFRRRRRRLVCENCASHGDVPNFSIIRKDHIVTPLVLYSVVLGAYTYLSVVDQIASIFPECTLLGVRTPLGPPFRIRDVELTLPH